MGSLNWKVESESLGYGRVQCDSHIQTYLPSQSRAVEQRRRYITTPTSHSTYTHPHLHQNHLYPITTHTHTRHKKVNTKKLLILPNHHIIPYKKKVRPHPHHAKKDVLLYQPSKPTHPSPSSPSQTRSRAPPPFKSRFAKIAQKQTK